jgi:hypothetical protein
VRQSCRSTCAQLVEQGPPGVDPPATCSAGRRKHDARPALCRRPAASCRQPFSGVARPDERRAVRHTRRVNCSQGCVTIGVAATPRADASSHMLQDDTRQQQRHAGEIDRARIHGHCTSLWVATGEKAMHRARETRTFRLRVSGRKPAGLCTRPGPSRARVMASAGSSS